MMFLLIFEARPSKSPLIFASCIVTDRAEPVAFREVYETSSDSKRPSCGLFDQEMLPECILDSKYGIAVIEPLRPA
jgi:hypothetical protein